MGDTGWHAVPFVARADPDVDTSPFPTLDDATAAIKDGNEYPVPTDVATDGCPKREAAATTAEGWDIALEATPGKISFMKDACDVFVRYRFDNAGIEVEFERFCCKV